MQHLSDTTRNRRFALLAAATVFSGLIPCISHAFDPAFGGPALNPFSLVDVGNYSAHCFVDIDGDGDQDVFSGSYSGAVFFQRNSGNSNSPSFLNTATASFGIPFSVGAHLYKNYSSPEFVDIDGDGDFDAFFGDFLGTTTFFRNTGSSTNPLFGASTSLPFGIPDVGSFSKPDFCDLDGDGDFDLLMGNSTGDLLFFRNTGNATNPAFAAATQNPFGLSYVDTKSAPGVADFEGDGDLDVFVGNGDGDVIFFRNTGNTSNPAFASGLLNPFGFVVGGSTSATPEPVDLDGDYDMDLIVGTMNATIRYFQNTTTAFETDPPSSIASINLSVTNTTIVVGFQASDAASGVDFTTLFVKRPGDAGFSSTGLTLPGTSGTFNYTAAAGNGAYEFYTIAIDNVGNMEAAPGTADDVITFDGVPPSIPGGMVRIDPTTTDLDAVEYTITFSESVGPTFLHNDIVLIGTLSGAARYYVGSPSGDPFYRVCVALDNPTQNGTIGIRITGVVLDGLGNQMIVPVDSPLYTINNFPKGDVSKNGTFDLADVALLADANLSLTTLP